MSTMYPLAVIEIFAAAIDFRKNLIFFRHTLYASSAIVVSATLSISVLSLGLGRRVTAGELASGRGSRGGDR
jgi:hypothetical protein